MSHSRNLSNGKRQSVDALENAVNELEDNITDINKMFIRKVLSGLTGLMNSITHGESGIFRVVLKWFGLYLDVHTSINPEDIKLLKYFENTIPTIITYIIGCLQYKTKDMPNYHYELLNIFEQLLENISPKVLTKIANFEVGTIGYLWNPIDIVGDFNTQQKALKILSILLKQFDDKRLNEELKHIKWSNSNLFQDKLKTIVQETKLSQHLENASRELLNNLNMSLTKSVLVYSFYCNSLEVGNKYTFYKPLNLQKFWVDVNYTPKTLSYSGRFKLYSKSRCENINVIVEVQTMKLENGILFIEYKQPGEFSKHSDIFTNLTQHVIKIHLSKDEEQRLEENSYIMEYFNDLNNLQNKNHTENHGNQDVFDTLKGKTCSNTKGNKKDDTISISNKEKRSQVLANTDDKSTSSKSKMDSNHKFYKYILDSPPNQNLQYNSDKSSKSITAPVLNDSPKTSREFRNEEVEHPIMKLRDRTKFFFSLVEEDSEHDIVNRKAKKKKSQNRKSRQSKARRKKVCKVTPTVDLTKIENTEKIKENEHVSLPKYSSPLVSNQHCNKVLRNVTNIYNICDTTYAKPCQSYRQFKTDLVSNSIKNTNCISAGKRLTKRSEDNLMLTTKRSRRSPIVKEKDEANKENVNPSTSISTSNKGQPLQHSKRIISPHLFESQHHDIIPPNKILRASTTLVENHSKATIDLTFDEANISNASFECEEVRGIYETPIKNATPMKTPVNVELLSNRENKLSTPRPTSAMNVSDFNDSDMELTQIPLNSNQTMKSNENNSNRNSISKAVQQILQDFEYDSHIGKSKDQNYELDNEKCGNGSNEAENNNSTLFPQLFKTTELPIKRELIVMHSRPIYFCQQNTVWTTPDKTDEISTNITTKTTTECQVTPTAVIMQQIQVSSKKSIILRDSKPKKFYIGNKAKKNLNVFYTKERLLDLQKDKIISPNTNLDAVEQIESKDRNNNIIIAPKCSAFNENCMERQSLDNISPLALKYLKQSTSVRDGIASSSLETTTSINSQLFNIKGVEDDLHKIIQNHNKNIHLRLENAQHLFQSNISKLYSKNVCELLQSIIQKSERQKFELEQFLENIGKLIKEFQIQYETFVKRTKEYDINKEVINYIMENFANMENHNIKTKDNQDLIEQLSKEHSVLIEKLLEVVLKNKTIQ